MKKATVEEWEAIGAQAKKARNELFELIKLTSGKVPLPINIHIKNSIKQLDSFRCKAEERMLEAGVPEDLHSYFNIFYGSNG